MHVVVCFVFLSPHFALATGFRFIVMPLLHECHCMFCFPLPPFEFANGFRFTAIPLLHALHCLFCIPLPFYVFANGFRFTANPFIFDCMSSNICSCALVDPLSNVLTLNVLVFGFRFIAIPSITSNVPVHFTAINQCPTWPVPF